MELLIKKILKKSLMLAKIIIKAILPVFIVDLWSKYKKKNEVWIPQFETTIFRNDDVSYDTNLEHFKEFCEVFHRHGYTQLHAVTLYGCLNYKYLIDGKPCMYNTIKALDIFDYESCKAVSTDFIGDNKELIDYLNSIPDEIGLHGLYHSNYSAMSYEKQEHDIKEGLRLLHELFPNKIIRTFIAPFNMTNEYTYEICEKYGLRVSALEGEHLEEMVHNNSGVIRFGQLYRYHHHRFYPESTQNFYNLNISKLDNYLDTKSANQYVNKAGLDLSLLKNCVEQFNAQNWYIYAFKDFDNRKHASLPCKWILKNIGHDKSILEIACGAGGMLYHLYKNGFHKLYGYDYDIAAVNTAKKISKTINYDIDVYQDNAIDPKKQEKKDVIVWVNGMYHLDGFTLEKYFEINSKIINKNGFLIFDMIDKSFNKIPNNQYLSQDWEKELKFRRPSEYKLRYSKNEVKNIAKSYGFTLVHFVSLKNEPIPRSVYVFQEK